MCEQGCVNYLGGFNCSCFDGFELVNGAQCQGIEGDRDLKQARRKQFFNCQSSLFPCTSINCIIISDHTHLIKFLSCKKNVCIYSHTSE